jgi:hypothetical protein
VVPSEDYSRRAALLRGLFRVKGERQKAERPREKKTMKTQTTEIQNQGSQSQLVSKQIKWNLFIGDEPYGFVHASSEAEALDRVRAFKRPFRAVPAPDE